MDSVWSVRMPEELKDKLAILISDSGLNPKDFLNQLVQSYELKETARLEPLANIDIEELSQITGRINHIFINLLERFSGFQKQKEDEFNNRLDEKNDMLTIVNGKIKEQEQMISRDEAEILEIKNRYEEIGLQHSHLSEAYESNKALILEYKEKNDTLSGLLTEYKQYKDSINDVKADFDKERELRLASQTQLHNAERDLTALKIQIEEEKSAFELKLQREIERLELQNERRILEITKEYQQKLITEQEMYSVKVRELLSTIEKPPASKHNKKSAPASLST